jgi:hypothetical protein
MQESSSLTRVELVNNRRTRFLDGGAEPRNKLQHEKLMLPSEAFNATQPVLLRLSGELRNKIYHHALSSSNPAKYPSVTNVVVAALPQVSRQFHREVAHLLLTTYVSHRITETRFYRNPNSEAGEGTVQRCQRVCPLNERVFTPSKPYCEL